MTAVIDTPNVLTSLVGAGTEQVIRSELNSLFWAWFSTHKTMSFKLKVWVIPVSVTVSKLEPVFELLFGAPPAIV